MQVEIKYPTNRPIVAGDLVRNNYSGRVGLVIEQGLGVVKVVDFNDLEDMEENFTQIWAFDKITHFSGIVTLKNEFT